MPRTVTTKQLPHLAPPSADPTTSRPGKRVTLLHAIVVSIGISCLLIAAVNLGSLPHAMDLPTSSAKHFGLEQFLLDSKNKKKRQHDDKQIIKESAPDDSRKKTIISSKISGLSCDKFGGPLEAEAAEEMVYWLDIPSDQLYQSPFRPQPGQPRQYMTFEPDGGGWNNIRMAMETVLGLAIATGRTLVLPPAQRMYLLGKDRSKHKTHFTFADFFPMEELSFETHGLDIITMQEFLEAEAMTGNLHNTETGEVEFPPENRTDWDGQDFTVIKEWLRNVTVTPRWNPGDCLATFPAAGGKADVDSLLAMLRQLSKEEQRKDPFLENPVPVNAPAIDRMRENLSGRNNLCVYDEKMQQAPVLHFMCSHKLHVRMLVHFYAFLFFEDWKEDVWMKRFMRDHVRYSDEIQCAAARVVQSMREYAKSKGSADGVFDTFHVRRGDFQFKRTRINATEILHNVQEVLENKAIVFVATDERDKKFFDPLREHYDIKFLDDFKPVLEGVNTNYFGMIDQLVASRGRKFFGCWHSTFTGFIHRMRAYHAIKQQLPGYEQGVLPTSYYYVPVDARDIMHKYAVVHGAFFNREFPVSWKDIDQGILEIAQATVGNDKKTSGDVDSADENSANGDDQEEDGETDEADTADAHDDDQKGDDDNASGDAAVAEVEGEESTSGDDDDNKDDDHV